jgi:hypothetical protein
MKSMKKENQEISVSKYMSVMTSKVPTNGATISKILTDYSTITISAQLQASYVRRLKIRGTGSWPGAVVYCPLAARQLLARGCLWPAGCIFISGGR